MNFSPPRFKGFTLRPAEFRDAGSPAYALHHLHHDPTEHTRHHVNSHPGRFPLANNFELRGVTRVYVPCARNIYSCMCVCVHMYARRPFGL